jgi:hypothetical protein
MIAPTMTVGAVRPARKQNECSSGIVYNAPALAPASPSANCESRRSLTRRKNDAYFLTGPSRGRDWWEIESKRFGFDWKSVALALEIAWSIMPPSSFELACRKAEEEARRHPPKPPKPRPTPQVTIEAVWYSVRARGLTALQESANKRRLATFDTEARRQLNERIARLQAMEAAREA